MVRLVFCSNEILIISLQINFLKDNDNRQEEENNPGIVN